MDVSYNSGFIDLDSTGHKTRKLLKTQLFKLGKTAF